MGYSSCPESYRKYVDEWTLVPTYPHDLIRQRLRSLLPLSEIGPRSVEPRSIQLLVKTGLDAKQLLIGRKLIPSHMSRRTSTECDVVSMMSSEVSMNRPCGRNYGWRQVNLPSLKLAVAARALLTDVSVRLECYQTEMLSVRKVHRELVNTYNLHLEP